MAVAVSFIAWSEKDLFIEWISLNPYYYTSRMQMSPHTYMTFSSRAAAIRKRSSPKSQVIFAFSWIGDFFRIFGINIF